MEAILGTIIGFLTFALIWFFILRPKKDETPIDEIKLKEEELKNTQINLVTEADPICALQAAMEG